MGHTVRIARFLCYLYTFQNIANISNSLSLSNDRIAYSMITGPLGSKQRHISPSANRKFTNLACRLWNRPLLTVNPGATAVNTPKDSNAVYFANQLKRKLKRLRFDRDRYSQLCEEVKDQIVRNFPLTLMEHANARLTTPSSFFNLSSAAPLNPPKDHSHTTPEEVSANSPKHEARPEKPDLNTETYNLGKLYEGSILGSLIVYLEMTDFDKKFTVDSGLSLKEKKARLSNLLSLLVTLEGALFSLFRNKLNDLKLIYINGFFNHLKTKSTPDSKLEFTNTLKSFNENLNNLVPTYFKRTEGDGPKKDRVNLRSLFDELIRLNLLTDDEALQDQLKETKLDTVNWNVEHEQTEFKLVLENVQNIYNSVKFSLAKESQDLDSLLQTISDQQRKIQEYNKLFNKGNDKGFNCSFTYRIPGTNLTISSTYDNGVNNIQLICIPDSYAGLVGPNGFSKSLPFGHLGLDFNLSF